MKKFLGGKISTFVILLATFVLAGVAIFTAIRLYQLRQQSISPSAPESKPAAATVCGGIAGVTCSNGEQCVYSDGTTKAPFPDAAGTCQTKTFSIPIPSPTASPSGKPPVSSPPPSNICGGFAGTTCTGDLVCIYSNGSLTPPFPDAAGTCQVKPVSTPSPSGKPPLPKIPESPPSNICGGVAGLSCPPGLVCIYSNGRTGPSFPDQSGTCQLSKSGANVNNCIINFTIIRTVSSPTPTATPTSTPTGTPTPTPTPTPSSSPETQGTALNSCGGTCGSNSDCSSDLICYNGSCQNPSCVSSSNCNCTTSPGTTVTTSAPTNQPSLPNSGTGWPTIIGIGVGVVTILGSLLLAI